MDYGGLIKEDWLNLSLTRSEGMLALAWVNVNSLYIPEAIHGLTMGRSHDIVQKNADIL